MLTLDEDDKKVVAECLRAACDGPFFPEEEFHTLMGIDRQALEHLLLQLPNIDWDNKNNQCIFSNCLNNLLGYPHGEDDALTNFLSGDLHSVEKSLRKIQQILDQ